MEALGSPKPFVPIYRSTQRDVQEDNNNLYSSSLFSMQPNRRAIMTVLFH